MKIFRALPLMLFLAFRLQAAEPDAVSSLQERLERAQELINQIELESEQVKSQVDSQKPQPISFGDGTIAFEMASYLPDFQMKSGQTAHLGFNLQPHPQVRGYLEIEAIGTVAVNRLLPQWEVQMERNNSRFIIKKGEARFENELILARAFRMILRPDLYEEGDLYYLFPGADDIEKYFRQTGRGVPNGFQLLVKSGWLQGLEAWVGSELVYAVNPMVFARYKRRLGPVDFSLMAQGIDDPNYISGKRSEGSYEAWLGIPLGDNAKWDLVGVAKPTRVGQSYERVDKVDPGQGTGGTEYLKLTVATEASDAMGVKARLKAKWIPFLEEQELLAEYSLPLAGNVLGVSGLISARPQRSTLITLEGGWQRPLIGPEPLVDYGTPGNSTGQLSGPRPYGSVVTVSSDPITGVNNREMTYAKATLEFNPGLGWFYKWRPRIIQDWNVNYDNLITPFSTAISLRVWNYPTGTDLGSYVSQGGTRTAEAAGSSGLLPTNGYVNELAWISIFTTGSAKWKLSLSNGTDFMGLSPVFGSTRSRPEIRYFTADLTVRVKGSTLSAGYAENVWGPDDWYRVFGIAIDTRYRASFTQAFGKSEISLSYEAWRDKDRDKYHAQPIEFETIDGKVSFETPIDQLMLSYAIHF